MKNVDKLTKRVTDAIDRHAALGLQGWELHISIVEEVTKQGCASCSTSRHYNTMWLEFEKDWLKHASKKEIDKVILHELLHAVFRDFDAITEDVLEYLGEPHRSAVATAYTHELEGIIEAIARTLNFASGSNVVQS